MDNPAADAPHNLGPSSGVVWKNRMWFVCLLLVCSIQDVELNHNCAYICPAGSILVLHGSDIESGGRKSLEL